MLKNISKHIIKLTLFQDTPLFIVMDGSQICRNSLPTSSIWEIKREKVGFSDIFVINSVKTSSNITANIYFWMWKYLKWASMKLIPPTGPAIALNGWCVLQGLWCTWMLHRGFPWGCVISGFFRGVNEICALLGFRVSTFRDYLSVPSSTAKQS
jgi:hypothetical protein